MYNLQLCIVFIKNFNEYYILIVCLYVSEMPLFNFNAYLILKYLDLGFNHDKYFDEIYITLKMCSI